MPISLTTPVKDYDDTLIGELIRFVENPDSVGFENGRWYSPKYHPEYNPKEPQWDKYNFGMGIDRNTNEFVKNGELTFHKDDRGREYLTEEEERNARNHSIANAEASYNNRLAYAQKVVGTNKVPSEMKKALTINAIYNLGQGTVSSDLFSNRKLMTAFLNGTDQEYSDIINQYYDKYDKANRGPQTNIFLNNYLNGNVGQPASIVEPMLDFSEKRDAIQPLNPYPKKIENIVVQEEGPYRENYGVTSSEKRAAQIRAAVKARHDYDKLMEATSLKKTSSEFKPKFSFDTGGFLEPEDAWDALPMSKKAEMMKIAINNGIYNLDDIRKKYNEFAEGGSKEEAEEVNTEKDYINTMERVAEENYRDWGFNNPDEALLHALNDNTYDYRGFYTKHPQSKSNASTHWTDEFKTVYHPTFSNESIYSGKKSQYNPNGRTGGFWLGENLFIPAPWQLFSNYAEGGKIYIKPENRGKFTALKERTGHSATWFKEHGTPAQKKMAVFALNAAKWKHGGK